MKKIFYLFALAGLILGSCQAKYTIAKRKYNKGFYIAKSGKKQNPDKNESTSLASIKADKITTTPDHFEKEIVTESVIQTSYSNEFLASNSNTQVNSVKIKNNSFNNSSIVASSNETHNIKGYEFKNIEKKFNAQASKKGDGGNTVLLVILSLFPILALIAVYIKDGKSVTMNFWIDLLLHFTIIGYAIFAILVVLDVVNLA